MQKGFDEMRKKELYLLIAEFNRGSQVDRSLKGISDEAKKKFRKALLEEIVFLMEKADNESLKNEDIRDAIRKVKNVDENISFGQAQKVINVTMKQYCFVTNRKESILRELDCPLDSTTMKGCKIKNNKMKNVTEDDYLEYQKLFEKKHEGVRIFGDVIYDDNRIDGFLKLNLKKEQNEND